MASTFARAAGSLACAAMTAARPAAASDARRSGSANTSARADPNAGSSAVTNSRPGVAHTPSAPNGVVTTGSPNAIASMTLTLGPLVGGHGNANTLPRASASTAFGTGPTARTFRPITAPASSPRPASTSSAPGTRSATPGHA